MLMAPLKQYFNRRLTPRDTIVVIAFVALLGGLGYLGYQFTTAKILEAKINAALPKVSNAIRAERGELVSAIEAYKAHFGVYPSDHVLSRQPLVVDPATNTLFYELAGVTYNPTNKMYQAGGLEPAEEKYVKEFFQIDGFRNCARSPDKIIPFLKMDVSPARQLHDDPDVFAVGFQVTSLAIAPDVYWEFQTTSWRYVASAPTNNPGKFDLWIELTACGRTFRIGNWGAVE